MSTKTEGQRTAEFIVSEASGTRSREKKTVTVPASTTLQAGHVLAKLTATGKYVPYDNAGSDGSEAAGGVLYETLINDTESPVDVEVTVLVRDCEVRQADLQWSVTGGDITAGLADLLALGIVAR